MRLPCSFGGHLEVETFCALEVGNHSEQIPGVWVSAWAKHAHQTLCRPLREAAQFLKPDGCVDVVAQYRFTSIEISGQETLQALAEQLLPVFAVSIGAGLHGFLEFSCESHRFS